MDSLSMPLLPLLSDTNLVPRKGGKKADVQEKETFFNSVMVWYDWAHDALPSNHPDIVTMLQYKMSGDGFFFKKVVNWACINNLSYIDAYRAIRIDSIEKVKTYRARRVEILQRQAVAFNTRANDAVNLRIEMQSFQSEYNQLEIHVATGQEIISDLQHENMVTQAKNRKLVEVIEEKEELKTAAMQVIAERDAKIAKHDVEMVFMKTRLEKATTALASAIKSSEARHVCIVCMVDVVNVRLPCSHTFCKGCIEALEPKKCPECRGLITQVDNIILH